VVNRKGEHFLNLMISQAPADYLRAHVHLVRRWKEAVEDYRRARARDPSSLDVNLYRDGGTALAETGRWKEAADAWQRAHELDRRHPGVTRLAAVAHLAAEDLEAFRRIAAEMETWRNRVARQTIAMAPDPLKDYAGLLRYGPAGDADDVAAYGALLYRARRYDGAARYLRRAIQARKGKGSASDWAFLAMALHHSKQQPEALQALAMAKELNKQPAPTWDQRVEIEHLLKEAELELSIGAK
jgi:tetratricopeptide (TPR) repeat protein